MSRPWHLLRFRWFWHYLLEPSRGRYVSRLGVIWCRFRSHPCGPVFYNPVGLEPDMTCKVCGDDLG